MKLEANCRTTAMGIMPHTSIETALELALSLDIPFWPQLPNVSFYEDMYVQASENFPGIIVDPVDRKLKFDTLKFEEELADYSQIMDDPGAFALSRDYSAVLHMFLETELQGYHAIRGQSIGPVSFGFKVMDESAMPIIYNDGVRDILFDFMQRKANAQYYQLKERNGNAFVWLDEPGLGWVFSALSGYNDLQAREDYRQFMQGLEGLKAIHLCAEVNLPYLLELGIEMLSFDAYQIGDMPKEYASAVGEFLGGGGVISWGIVPTDSASLKDETPESLAGLLSSYWERVSQDTGLSPEQIARQALIAPARCCLKNIGQVGSADEATAQQEEGSSPSSAEEQVVEKAFAYIKRISSVLRDKYRLST
ncbi:hypothetical protein ACFLVX_00230 [Chloroflexota bacterium]